MPRRFCIELIEGEPCAAIFDGPTQRCPPHQAAADKRRNTRTNTTARGYGAAHQAERARLLAAFRPGQPCARCGKPITTKNDADLGHTDDRGGYRGLEHRRCNRGAGKGKGKR